MPDDPCARGHCEICEADHNRALICCECGDAWVPWHPDIVAKVLDKEVWQW